MSEELAPSARRLDVSVQFVWLLAQMGAIAIAALRVPLWARAPITGEMLAVDDLVVVHILAGALLGARLARRWNEAVVAIFAAGPFCIAAAFVAARPISSALTIWIYTAAWIGFLLCCNMVISSQKWQLASTGLLAAWSIGGIFATFATIEYAQSTANDGSIFYSVTHGPLVNGLLWSRGGSWTTWLPIGFLIVFVGVVAVLKAIVRKRVAH